MADRASAKAWPDDEPASVSAAMTCEKFEAMVNQNDHPCCTQGDIECKPNKGRRVLMCGAMGVLRTRDMKSACETTIKQPSSRKRLAPA